MTAVHFLTPIPSPYQRELFAALDACGSVDLAVDYFASTAADRLWAEPDLAPYERVLPGLQLLRGGAAGRVNPAVPRRLREVQADVVVVSDYSAPSAQIAMRRLSAAGRPWVFWGEIPGVNARGPAGLWLRRRLQAPLAGAAAIAAIGSRASAAYAALFPRVPVVDIPYFCDLAPFRAAARKPPARQDDRVRLLFSGQLIPRKGADLLLAAFAEARQRAPELELRILGEGPMRGALERTAAASGARVSFLGARQPADLPALFADADAFVLPSRHDGWGLVVNEALGAGLPIVASDAVGAAHDLVVDGVNGLIVPAGDVGALRDALVLLARNRDRRQAMAAASRARAADWGLDEGVRRWTDLLAAITADAAAGPASVGARGR